MKVFVPHMAVSCPVEGFTVATVVLNAVECANSTIFHFVCSADSSSIVCVCVCVCAEQ